MKTQIKRFLLTLGFMTRIPVNVNLGEVKDEDMHRDSSIIRWWA